MATRSRVPAFALARHIRGDRFILVAVSAFLGDDLFELDEDSFEPGEDGGGDDGGENEGDDD